MRGDSKFYTADVAATAARYGASVSLTTGSNPSVNAAITTIPHTAWRAIHYPHAFVDDQTGELVSDAEVAEIPYTAFTSRPRTQQVTGRLIVRRVKRLNPTTAPGQDGLFDVWRHQVVFLTSDFETLQAESQHRGHAIIEHLIEAACLAASRIGLVGRRRREWNPGKRVWRPLRFQSSPTSPQCIWVYEIGEAARIGVPMGGSLTQCHVA